MNALEKIYNKLLKDYGPQGWWPTTKKGSNRPTYHNKGKLTQKQKLEIILSGILTQNTAWKNVEKAIVELNKKNLIDIDKILRIKKERLARTIRSAGYYNQKAKKLKNVCEFLKKNPIKKLEKMSLWNARELLLSVNGIGPETADSILLYALNKPIFVVDTYTKRIFGELGIIAKNASYDKVQGVFMKNLPHDTKPFNEYHALLVEHAKRHYSKKPHGQNCPLKKLI